MRGEETPLSTGLTPLGPHRCTTPSGLPAGPLAWVHFLKLASQAGRNREQLTGALYLQPSDPEKKGFQAPHLTLPSQPVYLYLYCVGALYCSSETQMFHVMSDSIPS